MSDHEPESYQAVLRELRSLTPDPLLHQRLDTTASGSLLDLRPADMLTLVRVVRDMARAWNRDLLALREQNREAWQRLQTLEGLIRRTEAECGKAIAIIDVLQRRLTPDPTLPADPLHQHLHRLNNQVQSVMDLDVQLRQLQQLVTEQLAIGIAARTELTARVTELERERGGAA